jgi:hypothetical protein
MPRVDRERGNTQTDSALPGDQGINLRNSAKTDRPGLAEMLNYAHAGDTVVVTAIDGSAAPLLK